MKQEPVPVVPVVPIACDETGTRPGGSAINIEGYDKRRRKKQHY